MNGRLRALLRKVVGVIVVLAGLHIFTVLQQQEVKDDRHQEGQRAVAALDLPDPTTPTTSTTSTTTLPPTTTTEPPETTTTEGVSSTTSTTSTTTLPPTTTTEPLPTPPSELAPDIAFGALSIERLGLVQTPLYEGNIDDVDKFALDHGVAHRPGRAIPGSGGNVVIGGHRTSRHAPFEFIETMLPGDMIVVQTTWGEYVYEVEWTRDMIPAGNEAEADQLVAEYFGPQADHETLTLYACTPKGKVSHRIIVFGKLITVNGREV